jgi:phosphoribosylanthranilate isomerase
MIAKTLPVVHPVVGVKICGVTCVGDALLCAAAGVEWIGLNFHPSSPRSIAQEDAALIVAALPASVSPVGLFADRPAAEVADVAERLGLDIVQLHGHEPPEDLLALGHLRLVRAFRLRDASDWNEVTDFLRRAQALGRSPDAVLIDAHVTGRLGGTGATVASDVLDCIPTSLPRLILAGGLTPENVAAKVARFRPWMVDVASGVELSPGRKDPRKVAAFVNAARSAAL